MQISHRRLPHYYETGQPLFVTFRLHGSLPAGHYFAGGQLTSGEAFVALDRLLDRELDGPLYLKIPEVAQIVVEAIEAADGHQPHAWVIMPNHVHLLMTPSKNVPEVMRRLKGVTARYANQYLKREGQSFWQHESYDRLVRNIDEFDKITRYILWNPVKAGLASSPDDFEWSSARLKPVAS